MKRTIIILILILVVAVLAWKFFPRKETVAVESFVACAAAGYPVAESYPRQCNTPDGKHFVEDVGNILEKMDKIQLASPLPGMEISSPVTITGKARGNWYFEASFPVTVVDWNGQIIGQGHAEAQGDWMTTEFVPFKATITFDVSKIQNGYSNRGSLILQKDNPSGLPENDDALEIPIMLK